MSKEEILFLGYDKTKTNLHNILSRKHNITHISDKILDLSGYDLVVSFGYRHILPENVLKTANCNVINIHISFLPWNRGADPNFWSFYDDTPKGVSIHQIDKGLDTGPIYVQREVKYSPLEDTFKKTHERLIKEAEYLFQEHFDKILSGDILPFSQNSTGTYHRKSDLPKEFSGWGCSIVEEIKRLKKMKIGV